MPLIGGILIILIVCLISTLIDDKKEKQLQAEERIRQEEIEKEKTKKEKQTLMRREKKFKDIEEGKIKGKILCVDIEYQNYIKYEKVTFLNPKGKRFERKDIIKVMTQYGPDYAEVRTSTYIEDESKALRYSELRILPADTIIDPIKLEKQRKMDIESKKIREEEDRLHSNDPEPDFSDGWITLYDDDEDVAYSHNVYTKENDYDD